VLKNILTIFFSMEISEIKANLSLQTVLDYYKIKADANGKANCPWHDDKTPSLQFYFNTNTFTCFSSNCTAGSGDMIDVIKLQEKCNTHEALIKATELTRTAPQPIRRAAPMGEQNQPILKNDDLSSDQDRTQLLTKAFTFFSNAIKQVESAKDYLEARKLGAGFGKGQFLEVGFNGARYHYRGGMSEQEMKLWQELGMMKLIGPKSGDKTNYRSWAKDCIIFPLKNKKEQIVSFYGRSLTNEDDQKHYYMTGRKGLYPAYPRAGVKQLILTESIIDAASLIVAGILTAELAVLACYGTNGLTVEHIKAIEASKEITEIIFFFDGDQAGMLAVDKHSQQLAGLNKSLIISKINTPDGEDINSIHQGHEKAVFAHLFENRTILKLAESASFSFSTENLNPEIELKSEFDSRNPEHIIYQTAELQIHIWGGIEKHNLSKLKISLHVALKADKSKHFRDEANLYSYAQIKKTTQNISESLGISSPYISQVMSDLTQKLESYRLTLKTEFNTEKKDEKPRLSPEETKEAMNLLASPNLLRKTLKLIEESGLVGQQKNGMLLFFLYLSRYFDEPLHAIIFGKSGSGKTYLQTKISDCIPPEDLRVVTSLTENTLYYSPKGFWKHKVLMIEDLEGVYQAFLPLREMMSKQEISKFTTDKDSQGNNVQLLLKVEGPICVSGATTKEWIYEDNANRSYLLLIDESKDHLDQVMDYQRREYAGQIDKTGQQKAKIQLQNAQRLLRKVKVINPYAQELQIPEMVFKKLRTNNHYLKLIQIISYYCQFNREIKTDGEGTIFIETNLEDISWANRLIKESLLTKSDELSGNLRQFFEILKGIMNQRKESEKSFYAKEIRQQLRLNPMTVNRHLRDLEMRSYIRQIGGNRKTGYEYIIELWEEYADLQKGIEQMDEQLEQIKKRLEKQTEKASITQV
jgi:DNA primase